MRVVLAALLALVLPQFFPADAQVPEAAQFQRMVVIDASGSMWNDVRPGSATRDQLARRFAKAFVARSGEVQPEAQVGIVAFGHQRKRTDRDCTDIQTVAPMQPVGEPHALGSLLTAIDGIPEPKGMTPLTMAVLQAARAMVSGGYIILISDFDETCDPDPCARMDQLRTAGALPGIAIMAVVATVGRSDTVPEMERFAECNGAKLLRVSSLPEAETLARYLADELRDATTGGTLLIEAGVAPPLGLPVDERLIELSLLQGSRLIERSAGARATFRLRPGAYQLLATIHGFELEKLVEIAAGETQRLKVDLAAAELRLEVRGVEGERLPDDLDLSWTITELATDRRIERAGPSVAVRLSPGHYRASVESSRGDARIDVMLAPDQQAFHTLRLQAAPEPPSGELTAVLLDVDVSAPTLYTHRWIQPRLVLRTTSGKVRQLPLENGTVELPLGKVSASINWGGGEMPISLIDLASGETTQLQVRFDPPVLRLHPVPAGQAIWTVRDAAGQEIELDGAELHQSLPPGAYTVRVRRAGATAEVEVRLAPGAVEEREIRLN